MNMMLVALCSTAWLGNMQPKEKTVRFWFEVSDTLLRPGESVEVTWWAQFDPGVGEPTFYKEYEAKVLFFQAIGCHLDVATNFVQGEFSLVQMNPKMADWIQFYGKPIGNSLMYTSAINFYPLINMVPCTDNPIWLYKYTWKPKAYYKDQAEVRMTDESGLSVACVALEVPALQKFFPKPELDYSWPYTQQTTMIEITDEPCPADCDGNANLNIDDFICFMTNYSLGDPSADCDADGQLTIDDFICFQTSFVLGC
jgi:hypothetical protein